MIYEQINVFAMSSPVSPVVAYLGMEAIEELAINTTAIPPKKWKRYVDDSFCIIKRTAVNSFQSLTSTPSTHTSLSALKKTLMTRLLSWTLRWFLVRTVPSLLMYTANLPTQTDISVDFFSHHDKCHKITAAETLLHRATKLPSTAQGRKSMLNLAKSLMSYDPTTFLETLSPTS